MNRKNRLEKISRLTKQAELDKKAQQMIDDINHADDSETAFNKVLEKLLDNIDIPALDEI